MSEFIFHLLAVIGFLTTAAFTVHVLIQLYCIIMLAGFKVMDFVSEANRKFSTPKKQTKKSRRKYKKRRNTK